jgi:lipopolysaccharide/colanic/teichoic acid biosynthesis glycosyltransferase
MSTASPSVPSEPARIPLNEVQAALATVSAADRGNSSGGYVRFVKRSCDFAFSWTLFLVLLIPGAILALLVKLDSRGPAFYTQERVGLNARPFAMVKFRSMIVGAAGKGAGVRVEKNDARVTRVGKFLRKTSLDELPQLFNIMRGEMSVIGPRPGLRFQIEQYTPEQRRRLLVAPGITGWAQIHGRNSIPWDERIRYDVEYVDRVSAAVDLQILARTFGVVAKGDDQIAPQTHFNPDEGDGYTDSPAPSSDHGTG